MKLLKDFATFVVILIPSLVFAGEPFNEKSFCGIDIFGGATTTGKKLIQFYGKGCVDADGWRYYYFPKHHVYGMFSVSGINTVTGLEISRPKSEVINFYYSEDIQAKLKHGVCTAKRELKTYQTLKGLGLGDSVKRLLKLYGKPSRPVKKTRDGVETYWYSPVNTDDDPFMTVEVKNGAVISIEIHSYSD